MASTSLRSLKRGPLVGQRLRRSKILMTLLIKRASVSAVGSLFQRELPTGVRDSVESAAGRSTSRPRFGKAPAFPKPQPGRASEAAPDPQPLAPSIRVAGQPTPSARQTVISQRIHFLSIHAEWTSSVTPSFTSTVSFLWISRSFFTIL